MWFALLNIGSVFALRSVREGDVMDEMAKTRREAAPWGVPGLVDLLKASITGSRDPSSPDVKETKLKIYMSNIEILTCQKIRIEMWFGDKLILSQVKLPNFV